MSQREIKFTELSEKWNYYTLSDGTTLKLKTILIKVIEEGEDFQGNPRFSLQTTNVIGISPSDSMSKDVLQTKKEDIGFSNAQVEVWNEYELENKFVLKLKPAIAQINRTGNLDPRGFPIYEIQAQTLIKLLK